MQIKTGNSVKTYPNIKKGKGQRIKFVNVRMKDYITKWEVIL